MTLKNEMAEVDELYLESLKEFIYDEKKVVTYKFLSVYLGVHVNLAKQMLYTFVEREKEQGKTVHSMMYLSGTIREATSQQEAEATDDLPLKHMVLLCKDTDLEKCKEKFYRLYSVHVYCISATAFEDYESLRHTITKSADSTDGRTPADYGPFKCSTDFREEVKFEPMETSDSRVKEEPRETSKETLSKDTSTKATPSGTKGKNFFGTPSQNGKSGNKKSSGQSSIMASMSKMKPSVKSTVDNSSKKDHKKSNKKKNDSSKKRKRIRMDSDSDGSDEHASTTSEDEESEVEEPARNKRHFLVSSESEPEEEPSKTASPEKPAVEEVDSIDDKSAERTGRKRVMKTIERTYTDEDGYLVTNKEQVMVSEDEEMETETSEITGEETEKQTTKSPIKSKEQAENSKKPSNNKMASPPTKNSKQSVTSSGSSSKSSSSQGKNKQSSITSFFQRK